MSKETYWVERKVKKKMLVNKMGNTFDNDNVKKKTKNSKADCRGKEGEEEEGVDLPRESGG